MENTVLLRRCVMPDCGRETSHRGAETALGPICEPCSQKPERCKNPGCGRETEYKIGTPIEMREGYIECFGQLCRICRTVLGQADGKVRGGIKKQKEPLCEICADPLYDGRYMLKEKGVHHECQVARDDGRI